MSHPQIGSPGVYSRFAPWAALLGSVVVAFAGCSSEDRAKPALGSAGTSAQAGKSSRGGTASAMSDSGAAGENAAGGDGNGGVPAQGGAPPLGLAGDSFGPPGVAGDPGLMLDPCASDGVTQPAGFVGVCTATKAWAAGSKLAVNSGAAPSFVGVTPSELTLLWREAPSSVPVYFLADRVATSDAFGDAQELSFANVLGVSPDGLRLTIASGDGRLLEATRAERGDSFGEAEPGAYSLLDADALAHHLTLGDVAIAPDDHSLYYSAWSLDDATPYPVRVSTRAGTEPWPVGITLTGCELKAYGAFGPRPTAVSSDGLTLFYLDAARGTSRAAFRTTASADFTWFIDLPAMLRPAPNTACDQLYHSPSSGEPRLLSAPRTP
jgi:hypothetical protein